MAENGGLKRAVEGGVKTLGLKPVYRLLAKALPGGTAAFFQKKLLQAGITEDAEDWAGSVILLALETGVIGYLFAWIALRITQAELLAAASVASFLLVAIAAYMLLFMQIEDRKKRLEESLPVMLRLVAANLRAGMTPMFALRSSARPEFGPVAEEIRFATAKALGTESFSAALSAMADRFDSDVFGHVVALFNSGAKSGGNLAKLLENASDDMRASQEMKTDLETSSRMYLVFIAFVVIIGTPLLFSISMQFTDFVSRLIEQQQSQGFNTGQEALLQLPFSKNFLNNAAIATLSVNALLAAGLVGAIREGKWLSGAKYAPLILAASLAAFFAIRAIAPAVLAAP